MEQHSGLGNQQENGIAMSDVKRDIDIAAARIAMFLDTDGFLTIQVRQRGIKGNAYLGPECGFVNTSVPLIEWLHETLAWLGIPHYLKWFTVDQLKGSRARKPQGRIVIRGQSRCKKLLRYVQPFLVAKKRQGELISELIESRYATEGMNAAYSDRELEIANEIRELNNNKSGEWRPISSETLRRTMELREKMKCQSKIKSDLHGNMQSTAETSVPVWSL